jgi:hypothetical protein
MREKTDAQDQWEGLGGGQTESMRSQVKEEFSEEGSRRVLNSEGGLLLARRI